MSDDGSAPDVETPSTRAYLRLVFLNPVSAAGIVMTVVGIVLVSLSSPGGVLHSPLPAAGLMLFGVLIFALGYTRAQRTMKRRRTRRDK